jgi:hypothetical protein
MKARMLFGVMIAIVFATSLSANPRPLRKTGIGFRGGYWDMNNASYEISVHRDHFETTRVKAGGGGGWLYVLSRVSPQDLFELSFGGAGHAETVDDWLDEEVKVDAVTPLLFGLRHELFGSTRRSDLYPYVSAGVGPYWIHHVIAVERRGFDDHYEAVDTDSKVDFGGYIGGGVNVMLTSWMGLNLDGRYHLVDFNNNHDYSGFELGFGMVFMWGQW